MPSRHRPPESLLFAEFCKKFPVLRRMSRGDRFVSDCAHTIDILLKKAKTRSSFRTMEADTNYVSKPKNGKSFKVYRKADKDSEVVGEVPGTAQIVRLKYWTPGLKDGFFWRVTYIDGLEDGVGPGVDIAFSGYADENDLDLGG